MFRKPGWLAVVLGVAACGPTDEAEPALSPEARLQLATVTVAERCAGVVVQDQALILTAAHCIREQEQDLAVLFFDGQTTTAEVATVDAVADLALLRLPRVAPFEGLRISGSLPEPGTQALFVGRIDRGQEAQAIQIVKRAPCPSLPGVPEALFTSLRGAPGDSGAPVVDLELQVIGLVHGGARCSVAAPTNEAPEMIRALEATAAAARMP